MFTSSFRSALFESVKNRYGLLGPSGCGKTSLLRCILNQLRPASGSISIFDSHPGDKGSLIPGPGVGYMPQEIALVMEFTIFETVHFFGKLHGMKKDQLEERSNFLLKFLDLPDGNRLVRDLR
jgi:ABC-type multidrug transport system ATPase subunit